jgi:hypothetical protein
MGEAAGEHGIERHEVRLERRDFGSE